MISWPNVSISLSAGWRTWARARCPPSWSKQLVGVALIWQRIWKNFVMRVGTQNIHDDVIKWKYFPRYWPFVRGIHRSTVNSLHKGQWRGAFIFSLICARINGWVNNREAGDLRRYRSHYDVIVMSSLWLRNIRRHHTVVRYHWLWRRRMDVMHRLM